MAEFKIEASLDQEEYETLHTLLHDAVISHSAEAKIDFLVGIISKQEYDWHVGHSKYLQGIADKLHRK